jgi:diguanylate cyclase (GGDEF)-like protein
VRRMSHGSGPSVLQLPVRTRGVGRSALRARLDEIRSSDYLVVGRSPRFRALQRRRTRNASRVGFLIVAAAVAVDATVLLGLDPGDVWPAIVLDVVVLVTALVGRWSLQGPLRHHPEATAFAVMTGVTLSTIVSGTLAPTLAAQTIGYLILLPTLLAMVLPWRTPTHLAWLLTFTVLATGYLATGPTSRFSPSERSDLLVVLVVAIGASIAGHYLLQHARIRDHVHVERIGALRRRTEADHRELERVHRELERTARIDPLTGAGNRRRLHEDLATVRSGIDRIGISYGLIEIDLDHFKGINDHLGHLAGDEVLRRVVEAIQGATRAVDAVYRYGGEEFVVIAPIPDDERLLATAERVRRAVESLGIDHPEHGTGVVTISIGAALLDRGTLALSDEQWFRVVDNALYAAKAGGRDQVRVARVLAA